MNTRSIQPPEQVSGPPPVDQFHRNADIALVEIAKLQSDVEHLKGTVGELRKDGREVRDRLIKLETDVSHLPSKGFIITIMVTGVTLMGAILTILPKLQALFGGNVPPA